MTDRIRTNNGYKYSWIEDNIGFIILCGVLGFFMLMITNFSWDAIDRRNYCESLFPTNNFTNYQNNKLQNEYCYKNLDQYNYTDRYFDIPPREYNG